MAEPYRDVMDFAFFAANFGYSKKDYLSLTATEKAFILKAWENKLVTESTLLRDSALNAVTNALRKKGAPFRKLWRKAQKPTDKEQAKEDIRVIEEIEKKEGKGWISKILEANGLKRKEVL